MEDQNERLVAEFGKAVCAKDRSALEALLAEWLDAGDVLEKLGAAFDSMLIEWELPAGEWPTDHAGGVNPLTYEDLRRPSDFPPGIDIPDEVTEDNFAAWAHVTFHPPEGGVIEFDAYCDAWFAVVKSPDGLRVGSLEIVDPD